MIQFPLLHGLFVRGYGLYPGRRGHGRLAMRLGPGPWMILGVNGLGKSTLLLIIRHMLAGPNRVTNAGPSGTARSDIVSIDKRMFAGRVSDGARASTATLLVKFGAAFFVITRRLDDLSLICCKSPGQMIEAGPEAEAIFQKSIASAMGLGAFEDALRVFRYMNFVLEDRDALIWDPKAQAEIFRAVFLPPERSARWRVLEGEIISADSGARNFGDALRKIIQRQERERQRDLSAPQLRAKLAALAHEQDRDEALEVEKLRLREAAEDRRIDARDSARLKEQYAEEKKRDYERLKFHAIRQALAEISPSEQYIFIKIISEHKCAACGNDVQPFATALESRQKNHLCLVCGQPKKQDGGIISSQEFSEERASRAYEDWVSSEVIAKRARAEFDESEEAYNKLSVELASLRRAIDIRNRDIRLLQRQLPADERQAGREYDEVASLRARINEYRTERNAAEMELSELLSEARLSVETVRSRIEA